MIAEEEDGGILEIFIKIDEYLNYLFGCINPMGVLINFLCADICASFEASLVDFNVNTSILLADHVAKQSQMSQFLGIRVTGNHYFVRPAALNTLVRPQREVTQSSINMVITSEGLGWRKSWISFSTLMACC